MVNTIYQKSFAALMKRPFRLWGISLLGALLCWLAGIGFAGILAVGFAIAWAIDVSLAMIFLHTYQTGVSRTRPTCSRHSARIASCAWSAAWHG